MRTTVQTEVALINIGYVEDYVLHMKKTCVRFDKKNGFATQTVMKQYDMGKKNSDFGCICL